MYMQVGDFRVSRGPPTVLMIQFLENKRKERLEPSPQTDSLLVLKAKVGKQFGATALIFLFSL